MKSRELQEEKKGDLNKEQFDNATVHILEEAAMKYCPKNYEEFLKQLEKSPLRDIFGDQEE
jgi:hypothetical protein